VAVSETSTTATAFIKTFLLSLFFRLAPFFVLIFLLAYVFQ
jgi:hypothetical protein